MANVVFSCANEERGRGNMVINEIRLHREILFFLIRKEKHPKCTLHSFINDPE